MGMEFASRGLQPAMTEKVPGDVRRIVAIWSESRRRFGADGPFLCGEFSIADAMFAPVASRFTTYAPDLAAHGDADGHAAAYREHMMGLPGMRAWGAAAAQEPTPPPYAG
jgi:glutathione S-transferase